MDDDILGKEVKEKTSSVEDVSGVVFSVPEIVVPMKNSGTAEPVTREKTNFSEEYLSAPLIQPSKVMIPRVTEAELEALQKKPPISIRLPESEETLSEGNRDLEMARPQAGTDSFGQIPIMKVARLVSDIPPLRTYRQDVASAIKNSDTSLIQMVLLEQKNKFLKEQLESPRSRKNLPLIILSFFFLFLTAGILYYTFFHQSATTTLVELHVTPLIGTETSKEIAVDGLTAETVEKNITDEISHASLSLDTLEYVYFTRKTTVKTNNGAIETKNLVSAPDFFSFLGIDMPTVLLRSLKPDFMFGIHSFNKNQPFLILKTDYYESAFAGMLAWENTMGRSMFTLFGDSQKSTDLSNRTWGDLVMKNKDLRVLYDFDGTIALVYMFKDSNTIIITTNADTLFKLSGQLDVASEKKI